LYSPGATTRIAPTGDGLNRSSSITAFPYRHEAGLLALLAGLLIVARMVAPEFLSIDAQMEMSTHVWELALLALPMALIIISGGIDLSVGSTMGLCAVALGMTYEAGASPWIAAIVALVVGIAAGALNGVFTAYVKVHPLIVTLATLAAYRGIAEGISLAKPVSGFPDSFAVIGRGAVLGVPIPGIIFAIACAASAVILAKTTFGRSVYAVGNREAAARLSGIAVSRIKMILYMLSGSAAAMAAIIFAARRNTAKADVGTGMELDVITAVVLGGVSILGGKGRILGVLLGILLIHETREFVSWQWNRDELNFIVVGAMLIASVLMSRRAEGVE
jgi:rhamnose transport system permease protein